MTWIILVGYLAAPEHRPGWMRVDRLLGEHGIQKDTVAGREEFERRMERHRVEETGATERKALRRGGCPGSDEFRAALLERMEPGRASFRAVAAGERGGQRGTDHGGGVGAMEVEGNGPACFPWRCEYQFIPHQYVI